VFCQAHTMTQLIIVLSEDGFASRLVAKYRPAVPQVSIGVFLVSMIQRTA
jgi:hypothetical protein